MEPFTKITSDYKIRYVDLKNNDLSDVKEFHYLKHLNVESIDVTGNDMLQKIANFEDRISTIMPSLKLLDQKSPSTQPAINLNAPVKLPVPIDLGFGNDPIGAKSGASILISYNSNRKEDFRHLRDSFNSYRDESSWTKVIIKGQELSKTAVIDILLSQVITDCVFFPCYYQITPQHHEFFIYRNFDALKCMMQKNLEFSIGARSKVGIELILKYAPYIAGQMNWPHKIRNVLANRIEGTTLNLGKLMYYYFV